MKRLLIFALIPLTLAGCVNHTEASKPGEGNLRPMSGQSQSERSPVVIATATVSEPVAAFDEPGGITIGSLVGGEFPVVDTTGNWVQIGVDGVYVWVLASEITFAVDQAQS